MKIKCIYALSISIMFIMTACAEPSHTAPSESYSTDSILCASEFSNSGQVELIRNEIQCDGYSSENGFFRIVPRIDGSNNLHFTDYNTKQETIVCNRLECLHTDESCPSWFPFGASAILPIPVGDSLVILHCGNSDFLDTYGSAALAHIELSSPTRENPQIICTFDATSEILTNIGGRQNYARDEENLYFIVQALNPTTPDMPPQRFLYACNITSGKVFRLKSLEETSRIVGAYDDKLVLESTPNSLDVSVDANSLTRQLIILSTSNLQETLINSHPYTWTGRCEDSIYYALTPTSDVVSIDLKTGKVETIIHQAFSSELMNTSYSIYNIYNKCLFGSFALYDEKTMIADQLGFFINIPNRSIEELAFHYSGEFGSVPFLIASESVMDYMVVTGVKRIDITIPISQTESMETYYELNQYAFIDKEDFLAGNTNFTELQNIS